MPRIRRFTSCSRPFSRTNGRERLSVGVVQGRREKRLLALDVEIQGALGHPHRLGDVRHLGLTVALGDEDARSALEQVFHAMLGDVSGHGTNITDLVSQSSIPRKLLRPVGWLPR